MKYLIIFGVLIRLLLSVTTYHRDLAAYTTSAKLILVEGHWLDFYDAVLRPDPQGRDYQLSFNYQPLAYYLPALVYAPFTDLVNQVADGLRHLDPYALVGQSIFLPLFIFKLPFLIADLLILGLLPKLFPPTKKQFVQVLWALNPAAIFVSSIIGQIDMVLLLFIILALLLRARKHYFLAAICLGISALTKPTALLLLPILALDLYQTRRTVLSSLAALTTGLATFIIGVLPFISSANYRTSALFTDLLSKSTFAGIAISPGVAIPWFFIAYASTIIFLANRRLPFLAAIGAALFSSLSFTHFHPQWFVWVTPWLVWLTIEHRRHLVSLLALLSWLIIWLSFGPALHLETVFGLKLALSIPSVISTQLPQLVLLARAWLVAYLLLLLILPYDQKA